MRLGHVIQYTMIYPEEKVPYFDLFANDIPTRLGIEYFSTFKAFLHLDPKNNDAQTLFIKEFLGISKIITTLVNFYIRSGMDQRTGICTALSISISRIKLR